MALTKFPFQQTQNMRHRIDIQQRSDSTDTFGQQIKIWKTVATVWAAVEPILTGDGLVYPGQSIQYETMIQVVIRYMSGLTPKMRVMFNNRPLEILSVENVQERNRIIVMTCREGLNDG